SQVFVCDGSQLSSFVRTFSIENAYDEDVGSSQWSPVPPRMTPLSMVSVSMNRAGSDPAWMMVDHMILSDAFDSGVVRVDIAEPPACVLFSLNVVVSTLAVPDALEIAPPASDEVFKANELCLTQSS